MGGNGANVSINGASAGVLSVSGSAGLTVLANGNVGFDNTAPSKTLEDTGTAYFHNTIFFSAGSLLENANSSSDSFQFLGNTTGTYGFAFSQFGLIGTTTTNNCAGDILCVVATSTNSSTQELFRVASSTGASLFSVNNVGGVSMPSLVSGNTGDYVCDNGGVIENAATPCSISSEKVKNSISDLNSNAGLSAILKLNPVTFRYDKGFGDSGAAEQVGLIAEPTAAVNPLFAEYATAPMQTPNGTIEIGQPDGINWEAITSATVLAIQEQQAEIDALGGKTRSSGSNQWEFYLLVGVFGLYVVYNEVDKRRK